MNPALLSVVVLLVTLMLFISNRVRHDLVAMLALLACLAFGLVTPQTAFSGFSDPAVLTVAAILVIGRAIELSGIAAAVAQRLIPDRLGFTARLSMLLVTAAVLSAFMNNIAALVITMPVAADIARTARRSPALTLMPLAFATILGGMTTLIGTPANLILSSVARRELGEPFGFFTMTPVGVAVCVAGLAYMVILGWRLLPIRRTVEREARPPWRVFELTVPAGAPSMTVEAMLPNIRAVPARMLAIFRAGRRLSHDLRTQIVAGDRLLLLSRNNQWRTATGLGLIAGPDAPPGTSGVVTARVVVAHGSPLDGLGHEEVRLRSGGALQVSAVGPRAARVKIPLASMQIRPGDQLFIRGAAAEIARFTTKARLLEIDRLDRVPVSSSNALLTVAIFALSILAVVSGLAPPAIAFVVAATAFALLRLIPADQIYESIDWSVILLLAAMIPVGQSFETSGAAAWVANALGDILAGQALVLVLGALCAITLVLSIFLNNVATAVIMGPVAIEAAGLLGISPQAALLAVLIGTSSDFLTPIGHQNNLLVMGPGGYRFTDFARMGGLLVVIVVVTAAVTLSLLYA